MLNLPNATDWFYFEPSPVGELAGIGPDAPVYAIIDHLVEVPNTQFRHNSRFCTLGELLLEMVDSRPMRGRYVMPMPLYRNAYADEVEAFLAKHPAHKRGMTTEIRRGNTGHAATPMSTPSVLDLPGQLPTDLAPAVPQPPGSPVATNALLAQLMGQLAAQQQQMTAMMAEIAALRSEGAETGTSTVPLSSDDTTGNVTFGQPAPAPSRRGKAVTTADVATS